MKLKTFAVIFVIVVLALFTALSVSVIRIADFLDRDAGQLAVAADSIRTAQSLKSRMLTHNRNAFLYTLTREPSRRESSRAQGAEIAALLQSMRALSNSRDEDAMVASVEREVADYLDARGGLDQAELSATQQYNEISQFVDDAVVEIDALIALNRAQMGQLMEDVNRQNAVANSTALTLLTAGGVVLVVILIAILALVTWPLSELSRAMARYGHGENDARVSPRGLQEIRHIGGSFNAMADQLEARRQEQLRIVSLIAHDLRTPLHAISMSLEALALKSPEEHQELVRLIDRQVKYLDQLVGDFLEASRIESGRLSLEFAEMDIRPLIWDAVDIYRNSGGRHEFAIDIEDRPLVCRCDRRRLLRVFNNLISNAVKYSPRGGKISVKARGGDGEVVVEVTDPGIGIEPEDREDIFKPFYRADTSKGTYPGLGLGLSSTRRLVEAHEGAIEVESEPGKGSTFRVSLPALDAGMEGARGEPEAPGDRRPA